MNISIWGISILQVRLKAGIANFIKPAGYLLWKQLNGHG
jgi:hypothetical protein